MSALLQNDAVRLARRYDTIVIVSAAEQVLNGLPSVLPIPDVVYCVRAGQTPIAQLKRALEDIERTGGRIRGIVLWNAPDPILAGSGRPSNRGAGARDAVIRRLPDVCDRRSVVLDGGRSLACQRPNARQRIDLRRRLVVSDAHDAREAQRVARLVTRRALDDVERDLENDFRTDGVVATESFWS